MSNRDENQQVGKYQFNFSGLIFLPIIIALTIVPLMVRLSIQPIEGDMAVAFKTPQVFDFFAQYKAGGLMLVAGLIVIFLFLFFQKQQVKWDKLMMVYMIGLGIYMAFTVLATILSPYQNTALWGAPDRAEGLIVLGCYVVLMLYTIYAMTKTEDLRFIIAPLGVLVVITTVLGVFQYAGKDLLMDPNVGRKLIVPEAYAELRDALDVTYQQGKVYGTMFHYNYMGSFGAMMVPLFGVLLLTAKDIKARIGFGLLTVASLFLLLGSTSRAGLIGVACSGVIFLVIFAKYLVKKWKITLPLVVALGVLLIFFDRVTGGTIFERIPTLLKDAVAIVQPADENFNLRDHLPVRDIRTEAGKLVITTQTDELVISGTIDNLSFADQAGNGVEYVLEGNQYTTADPRFAVLAFELTPIREAGKMEGFYVVAGGIKGFVAEVRETEGVQLIHSYTKEPMVIEDAPTIGFKGKERLGSARGYIWSRSLPLLKDTMLWGYGPDTYILEFPQNDYMGKWYAYDTPLMTVDKPHNLYLQIAINNGVMALVGFLILVITYVVDSLRLYAFKGFYNRRDGAGIAFALAIVGYLGAGIFNDSIISVAPIFWILLGTGIALNYFVHVEKNETKEKLKVIQMKKHR